MIRLIAIDMDGTILSPDHTINERNKQAILKAQENGIEVLIATGRSFAEAYIPVMDAGLTVNYICLNGAEVRDASKNVISVTPLFETDIEKITSTLDTEGIHYELFIENYIYSVDIEKQIDMFVQAAHSLGQSPPVEAIRQEVMNRVAQGYIREVASYDEIIQKHPNEIYKIFGTAFNNQDGLLRARAVLQPLPGLAVTSSGQHNIEINNINAQKGIALEKYAASKGIAMKDVMAIGDSFNDQSMLERAGRSVAMENSPTEIKAICTHTTTSNEADGVALAIEEIL